MSEKSFMQGINETTRSKKDFFNELIPTVWEVLAPRTTEKPGSVGTGFCINAQGLVLTCFHIISGYKSFVCKNLSNELERKAKVVLNMPRWDISLIKLVHKDEAETFDYVKFGDELDELFCGQSVYAIGNPGGLNATFMRGIVAYPCVGYNTNKLHEDFDEDSTTTVADIMDPNQSHRTMGSIAQNEVHASLSADFPIIQISKMSNDMGSSGCPVFNKRGCVVGMVQGALPYQTYAIHYCAINYFIMRFKGLQASG